MPVPGHIVFVDKKSKTVNCITESGEIFKSFDIGGLIGPSEIAIYANHYFICDFQVNIIGHKYLLICFSIIFWYNVPNTFLTS